MAKQPKHRLHRAFPEAKRVIVECDLDACPHCGSSLKPRKPWHSRKYVQTLTGPLFVAGRSKECANAVCSHAGQHYYANRTLMISLPYSTYGLDVLAFIGWQHEHEHRQLKEIQGALNRRGIAINERNVGKLYRQFLALLAAADQKTLRQLEATMAKHGGLIWAVDALQPEGSGRLLYVLYEVLSGTPVAAAPLEHATAEQLATWLAPYQKLPFAVLATLSDGEEAIIAALKHCWPNAPHQRCQTHFLNNLVEPVLEVDAQLRQALQNDLGGLPAVPESEAAADERLTGSSFVVCRGSQAGPHPDRPGEADPAGHPGCG
jgi:Transposase, Mutator family